MAPMSCDFSTARSTISRPTGIISAPPSPWTARASTRLSSDCAMPHPSEASVNTTMARQKVRRAPKRSALQPLMGRNTARLKK